MKKLLLAMGMTLLLVACGTNAEVETGEQEEKQDSTENMSQAEWMEEQHSEGMEESGGASDDPLEVADKSNAVDTFIDGANEYEVLYRFENEDTDENGLNTLTFGDFEIKFAVALTEDINGSQEVSLFGERINNNDYDMHHPFDTEIVTDLQEQTNFAYGDLAHIDSGIREKVFLPSIELEYESPESIELLIHEPVSEDETSEEIRLEFHKEE